MIHLESKKTKRDFSTFKKLIHRAPTSRKSYSSYENGERSVRRNGFSLEEITDIITSGDLESLRELSLYYNRTSGVYRNNVDLLSNLSLYQNIVTPIFDIKNSPPAAKITQLFYKACDFVDKMEIAVNFARITRKIILVGAYFGILQENSEGHTTILDLPYTYCRSRFKDFNNLDILEFNVRYFDIAIQDESMRHEALVTFPRSVQLAYKRWHNKKIADPWIAIPAEEGGMCFFLDDRAPLFIASIPEIFKLEESIDREGRRDQNELYKILIQEMPIDSKGELVFELEEIADIHESVAEMLRENDTIDVLTTLGKAKLESIQDSSSASQSADRIEKYKNNVYDSLGRSSLLFNATGSASLSYSLQKDESIIMSLNNQYSVWIKHQINKKFANKKISFNFEILPTTIYNLEKSQKRYFEGAQYGYSKMYAGVAVGLKQTTQLSSMIFENEILHMTEKMIPLRSSYTSSGEEIDKKISENTDDSPKDENISSSRGRPELDVTEKTDKTLLNESAEEN